MQEKIVFIGGPGSGKSTIITELKKRAYTCMPEISREVTLQARKDGIEQLFLTKPLLFSEKLLNGRIQQYIEASNTEKEIVFFDRGIPSVHAYLRYFNTEVPEIYLEKSRELKYTKIFQFLPWREIYTSDNERYESFEEATLISEQLHKAYQEIGYEIIDVPFGTIENRCKFILQNL